MRQKREAGSLQESKAGLLCFTTGSYGHWTTSSPHNFLYVLYGTKCFKPEALGLIPTFFRFHLIANIKQSLKLFLNEERRDIDQGKAAKMFINK